MTSVTLHLTSPQGEVGGGEVPVDEAVGDGALDVGVEAVHTGPQGVPHGRTNSPAHSLKSQLKME